MGTIVENEDLTEATFDVVMGYQLKMVIGTEWSSNWKWCFDVVMGYQLKTESEG